jgi:ribose/xylose/arabinose/galactoside ABC-type transport system permease subunit
MRRLRVILLHPEISILAVNVLLCLYLGVTNQYFFEKTNLLNITDAVAVIGIAGSLATYVVIIGGLDLTPVTIFVISGIVVIHTIDAGWPTVAVVAAGIISGGIIGALNGVMIARFELNPVIVTLGMTFLFTGIAFVSTGGQGELITDPSFLNIWSAKLPGGVPIDTAIMAGVYLGAFLILRFHRFGIHIYAVGGDVNAARLNGINTVRVQFAVYCLAGLAAGLGGVVLAGISGSVAPFGALSQTDLLKIIAAIVIGGASLAGGRGNVYGTLLGVLLFGIIANGLVLKNIASFYQPVVIGTIMLMAVFLEKLRSRMAVEA